MIAGIFSMIALLTAGRVAWLWNKNQKNLMMAIKELKLLDSVSFVSLLKCQQALRGMQTGELIELLVDDDVADDLVQIARRAGDRIVGRRKHGLYSRICIQKGMSSPIKEEA